MTRRCLLALGVIVGSVLGFALAPASPAAAEPTADSVGVVRAVNGHWRWLIRTSPGGGDPQRTFDFGVATDVPVWGDWNNDGVKTPGVFRNGQWLLKNTFSSGNADVTITYGRGFDMPVVGDWDGNGTTGIGVVRGNKWLLRNSIGSGNHDIEFDYGTIGDHPVVGDWFNQGADRPGMFRDGHWLLKRTLSGGKADLSFVYGRAADAPIVGDWDGAGGDGIGVFRDKQWLLRQTPSGGDATTTIAYGVATDRPVYATGPLPVPDPPSAGLTLAQLRQIYTSTPESITDALSTLNSAMAGAGITTARRKAAFVANLIVESRLQYDIIEPVSEYCGNYEGGCEYRGRGFIQLTHDYNYRAAGNAFAVDMVAEPDLARSDRYSPRIAVWFWNGRNLNDNADALDIYGITIRSSATGSTRALTGPACSGTGTGCSSAPSAAATPT
jgi:predicted chitinase